MALLADLSGDLHGLLGDAAARGLLTKAVLLVLRHGRVVYREALGVSPRAVFDLASLTKVVATAPSVMQLVEQGRLALDDPVARHLSWLRGTDKTHITVGQLLTHTAGLPSVVWAGPRPTGPQRRLTDERQRLVDRIVQARLVARPGVRQRYSDVGYLMAGLLVQQASGQGLARYASRHLFSPLGMCNTGFAPPPSWSRHLVSPWPQGGNLGVVYDPMAARCGGVAGHAGLYATADDLGLFAQMLLDGGVLHGARVLSLRSVDEMTRLRELPGGQVQGLGWRAQPRRRSPGVAPFGHPGFTGSWLWIDPHQKVAVVLLSDRTHREPAPSHTALRRHLRGVVQSAVLRQPAQPVTTGLDRLAHGGFAELRGLRVGVITNHTAVDSRGRFIADLLAEAPRVKLAALFAPEHGLRAAQDRHISDGVYRHAGRKIPVYSLFGRRRRPSAKLLRNLDALVFDVQTVGVRYYTYLATMGWSMREAARHGLRFFVLDRPNPLGGVAVQGPVSSRKPQTSANFYPLPVRHGMTVGELARLFRGQLGIRVGLTVIRAGGWRRSMGFDQQGRRWINPSPNLRNWRQALLYAAVGLLEGTNLSVGRGTDCPFCWFGAPWIDGPALAAEMNRQKLRGVHFVATTFRPKAKPYRGRQCHGVRLLVTDAQRFDPVLTGAHLVSALARRHRRDWDTSRLNQMFRHAATTRALIASREPVQRIAARWRGDLRRFRRIRRKYLLYR